MIRVVVSALMVVSFLLVAGNAADAKKKQVGIAWVGKSGMANRVMAGFNEVMNSRSDFEFEIHPALPDLEALEKKVTAWEKSKDGMVILRSNGAQWLGRNSPKIPTFIGGCNHPKILGAVKNPTKPEGNITGVTYFIPYNFSMSIIRKVHPRFKTVVDLLHKGHPTAAIERELLARQCKRLGLGCKFEEFDAPEQVLSYVEKNKTNTDIFVMGATAMVMDIADKVVEKAGDVPVFSFSQGPVKIGAGIGFAADDNKLGRELAQSVIDVVVNGKKIKDVPIKFDQSPKIYVNKKSMAKWGFELPKTVAGRATYY